MMLSKISFYSFFVTILTVAYSTAFAQTPGPPATVRIKGPTETLVDNTDLYIVEFLDNNGKVTSTPAGPYQVGWYVGGSNSFDYTTDFSSSVLWTDNGAHNIDYDLSTFDNFFYGQIYVNVGPPDPVNAGPDRSYCKETGSINLWHWGLSLDDGSWSGSGISGDIINLASLEPGTYTYTYTRSSDNTSDAMILTVLQSRAGTLTLQPTISCGPLTGSLSALEPYSPFKQWERSYDIDIADGASTWEVLVFTGKTYAYDETRAVKFRAGFKSGNCNIAYSETTTIKPIATIAGTVDAAAITVGCEAVTGSLSITGNNSPVIFWERFDNNSLSWLQVPNSASNVLANVNETAAVKYRAAVQQNQLCTIERTPYKEFMPSNADGGILSTSQVQFTCGRATGTLKVDLASGDTFTWEMNDGSGWGFLASGKDPYSFDVRSQTSFRLKAERAACPSDFSNEFTAYVSSQPGVISITSGNAEACGSATTTFGLDGFLGTILQWEYSTDNITFLPLPQSAGVNPFQHTTLNPLNYYRAVVVLDECAAVNTSPVTITVASPTVPGQVFLHPDLPEIKIAETVDGVLTFYPQFILQGNNGSIQNWWKNEGTGPVSIAETTTTLLPSVTATTAFSAQVKNGACDPLVSGQATFVVNRLFEGIIEVLDYRIETEYTANSFIIKNPEGMSIQDGFSFHANTAQEFFVVLDESYSFPPTKQNYVLEEIIVKEGVRNSGDIYFLNAYQRNSKFTYVDGVGRPVQEVQRRANPEERDIVLPITYDAIGRPDKNYLPYAASTTSGHFQENGVESQSAFYLSPPEKVSASDYPYAVSVYDRSPLNRIVEQGTVGTDWQPGIGHTVKYKFETNGINEVRQWSWNANANLPVLNGYYSSGVLYVKVTVDEHASAIKEFTNKRGMTILKLVQNDNGWVGTEYIYDEFDLLRFVIQPEGVALLTNNPTKDFLNTWAFEYKYDGRKRLVEKRVPGAGSVYMVYDNRDRLVLTQDANQRRNNQWTFIKYDAINRPVMTGIYTYVNNDEPGKIISRSEISLMINKTVFSETFTATGPYGYSTNQVFPIDNIEVLTVTYYDNYRFKEIFEANRYNFDSSTLTDMEEKESAQVTGLVTGSQTRILNSEIWLKAVNYYDDRYRLIQTISDNHLKGKDKTSHRYDFAGKLLANSVIHQSENSSHTVAEEFTYDHAGRLLAQYHKIGDGPKVNLSTLEYNDLNQLVEKNLHAVPEGFMQSVDYRYNIRGWLTRINDSNLSANDGGPRDYFGMELGYNDGLGITSNVQYNGNISAVKWSTNLGLGLNDAGLKIFEPTARGYVFTYDPLNRLKTSSHFENTVSWNAAASFHENIAAYDLNGNIKNLTRTGKGGNNMDILDYDLYRGNQLLKVIDNGDDEEGFKDGNDTGDDYIYDDNGNMITDKNKEIATIEYNHLNLPSKVTKNDGQYIKYIYNAAGAKLSQEVYDDSNVPQKKSDYLGEFFYENDVLQFINHEEGRVVMTDGEPEYQYTLKDHLGNTRITFTSEHKIETFNATMDPSNEADERQDFGAYNNYPDEPLDPTPAENPEDQILILNGSTLTGEYNGQVGLTKSFDVVPGDVITVSVNAKSLEGSGDGNLASFAAALTQAFLLTPDPQPMEGITPFEALNAFGTIIANGSRDENDNLPQGFLNILVFDKDYNLVDAAFEQVGTSVTLTSSVEIRQAGYVYVFLSNDGVSQQEIGFDNYSLTYEHSDVIQSDDYYPFGLTFNSYSRENSTPNQNLYNGKELQDELALNTYDFGWRQYDPAIARWNVVDPLAEKRDWVNPYNYVQNNPMNRFDPNGLTDYTLDKKTGDVKKVEDTKDEKDRIVKTRKDGSVKRKGEGFLGGLVRESERGKAKTAVGGIEKGILKDGQNFRNKDEVISVGGEGQASVDGVKSFTLRLSEYIGKEIKGFSYSSNASGNATDMVLGKYKDNTNTESYGTLGALQTKYGANFSFNNVLQEFHTHPDGKLGATESSPGLSQDVTGLQNDKPFIPNASFIILYRITGQEQPGEYDYTHHYKPKK